MERFKSNLPALFTLLLIPALGFFLAGCPKNRNPISPFVLAPTHTATVTESPTPTPTATMSGTPTATGTFTDTLTPTPTCASTSFGFFSNVNPVTLPNNAIVASALYLPDRAIVKDMRVFASSGGNFMGLIYSEYDTGVTLVPGAIVGVSSVYDANASGWVTTGFNAPVTLDPGAYFLGAWTDTGNIGGYQPGSNLSASFILGIDTIPTFWSVVVAPYYPVVLADYTCFN